MQKENELIGFHYTSLDCWESIQKTGLKPYTIIKPALRAKIGTERVNGIWLWTSRLYDLPHIGCVLYQMSTKNTTKAVLLSVGYPKSDRLSTENGIVVLYHSGHIGNLEYHTGEEEAVIITEPIPPEKIRLLQTYDLMELWKNEQGRIKSK